MLENDIKCDYTVNRGRRVLQKILYHIFSMFSAKRKENFIIASSVDNSK